MKQNWWVYLYRFNMNAGLEDCNKVQQKTGMKTDKYMNFLLIYVFLKL